MKIRFAIISAIIGVLGATMGGAVSKAVASDIIDEWTNVKTPVAPDIKPVTVDPKTTALIMGDLVNQLCGKRPRCVAALPAMKKLLGEARAAKGEKIPFPSVMLYSRGLEAKDAGKKTEAISLFNQALAAFPDYDAPKKELEKLK